MIEWKKIQEDAYIVIYEQKESDESYNRALFDIESKLFSVTHTEFVRNNEPRLIPQNDSTYYSAKYGHWTTRHAYLGLEDLRVLSSLAEKYLN